jgi:hypothetical protein
VSAKEAQTKGSYPFEERETWTAICAIPSGSLRSPRRIAFRWSPDWCHLLF